MRAPFQVLVIPFRVTGGVIEYAALHRADDAYFQFVAGGGEGDESPAASAEREFIEEAGVAPMLPIVELKSCATIPVDFVGGRLWDDDVLVIPEYAFGAEIGSKVELTISDEHTRYEWGDFKSTAQSLKWDSNRNALWELNQVLIRRAD